MSKNKPSILKINVVEDIKMTELAPGTPAPIEKHRLIAGEDIKVKEVSPGTPAPTQKEIEENLPKEEIEKRRKMMLEYTRLSGRYCLPHNKKSRWVKPKDLPRVLTDGKDLIAMCNLPRGQYSGIVALAHSQIDNQDPLRFFVLPTGMVIINPVLTKNTKTPISKDEGCMSFPERELKNGVERYNKVIATYQTLVQIDKESEPVLSDPIIENLSSGPSHIFQHECGHLNGCNIYDDDYEAQKSMGFGDGLPVDPKLWDKKVEKINK